jgi:hypothetical protein
MAKCMINQINRNIYSRSASELEPWQQGQLKNLLKDFTFCHVIFFSGYTIPNMMMKSWVGRTENEFNKLWAAQSNVIDNVSKGEIIK